MRNQINALDAQLADRQAYLTLATDLEGFLTQLHHGAETSTTDERRRVLQLLVKDVLIGPEKITIQHRIPIRERTHKDPHQADAPDTEGDHQPHCQVRWRRNDPALWRASDCTLIHTVSQYSGREYLTDQTQHLAIGDSFRYQRDESIMRDRPERTPALLRASMTSPTPSARGRRAGCLPRRLPGC